MNIVHEMLDKDFKSYCDNRAHLVFYTDELNRKLCYLSSTLIELHLYDDSLSLYYGRILYNTMLGIHTQNWAHPYGEEYKDTIIINHLLDNWGMLEWGSSIRTPWFKTYEDRILIDNYNGFILKLTDENIVALLTWVNPALTRLPYKSYAEVLDEEYR